MPGPLPHANLQPWWEISPQDQDDTAPLPRAHSQLEMELSLEHSIDAFSVDEFFDISEEVGRAEGFPEADGEAEGFVESEPVADLEAVGEVERFGQTEGDGEVEVEAVEVVEDEVQSVGDASSLTEIEQRKAELHQFMREHIGPAMHFSEQPTPTLTLKDVVAIVERGKVCSERSQEFPTSDKLCDHLF